MQLFEKTPKNGGGEELTVPKLIDYDGKQVCPEHFKVLNESGIKAEDIETNKLGEVVSLTLDFKKLAAWLNSEETFKEKINPIAETFSSLEKLTLKTRDYSNQVNILGDELRKFTGLKTLEITTSGRIHNSLFDEACWACRYIETLEKLVIVSENTNPLGVPALPHGIQGIYYAENLKQLDLRECFLTDEQRSAFYQFSKETKCEVLFSERDDRIKKNEVTMNEDEIFDRWLERDLYEREIERTERKRESR